MKKWLLVLIVLLGLALRVLNVSKFPVGFTPDEASFGYDAYSILKTGSDQWGNKLPLVLKSFGDYKAPLFSYILIPSVAIAGLTKEAVRIPNALVGTLAIIATYLLVLEVFKNKNLALISSFLLAVSSWHIMMSRGGFEANLTTLFLPLGLYLLLRGLKQNGYLYLGVFVLGLNLFTYHAAKVVTPLMIFFFLVIYRREIFRIEKVKLILTAVILLVFGLATLYTFSIGAGVRVKDVSIFNGSLEEASVIRHKAEDSGLNPVFAKAFYNKFTIGANRFVSNYVSYFSPQFLFTRGPAEATYGMIPGIGVLYIFELPFLLLFFISLARAKNRKGYILFGLWVLVSPIAAALATGPGYAANRAEVMLPALEVIVALGVLFVPWRRYKTVTFVYSAIALLIVVIFLSKYFTVSRSLNASAMLYGNYEVANYLSESVDASKKVIVDKGLSEPHIYVAFANRIDPTIYQEATKNWKLDDGIIWVDQIPDYSLSNYEFKTVHPIEYKAKSDIYLVGKKDTFLEDTGVVKTLNYPDGEVAIKVVKL